MKRILTGLLVLGLLLSMASCNTSEAVDDFEGYGANSSNENVGDSTNNQDNNEYNGDEYNGDEYNGDEYNGGENNVGDYNDDTQNNNDTIDIEYISDRRTQHDNTNKQQIVFFGLQDDSGNYVSSSGVAKISITDSSNEVLFQKDISFSSNDFTDWTNQQWDSSRYLCGLYINDSEIAGSASSSGNLSIAVELDDGTWFDAKTIGITDLPPIQVKINLPAIPSTFSDTSYNVSVVQVTKLEYTTNVNYDGTATVYFDAILKLVSKAHNTNESSSVHVGYKVYNSEGLVVDSGQIYSDPIAIGEACLCDFNIYNLNPRDTYTLKFENAG